jgi:hypothetical protein
MIRNVSGPLSAAFLVALSCVVACTSSGKHQAPPPPPPTPPSIAGTIRHVGKGSIEPVAGAQVCIEGATICATSASDGTFALGGITPGAVFVSASATGFLPGETRQAVVLGAGDARTGVDVILSGRPGDTATYVGSGLCFYCHGEADMGWGTSAHRLALSRTTGRVDVTGWPAAPSSCTAPATVDTGITGADPAVAADRELYLVRWKAGCGTGKPEFAMAFDTNLDGSVDDGDTIIPVTGSVGGVATGAGQCGNGGILPDGTPCSANLGGSGAAASKGWWQQEYLTAIGGSAKPAWVTWDTSRTPADALVMPLAWNQRAQQWVAAPDYNTAQDGTWSKACAGCHEVGLTLAADADGLVTEYAAASSEMGCEKCHGPASDHLAHFDPRFIVNPRYLTAQAAREVCAQCHSQGVASASPAGAFGFAWNDAAAVGGGNFIPGVHQLSDFMTGPGFGDPDFYWPAGFPAADHLTATDLGASTHATNPYQKVTCSDCHSGHAGAGGPTSFVRADETTGDRYAFQDNDAALRDNVVCLACHAGHGSFAALALSDAAAYHVAAGGKVQKDGAAWTVSAGDQAAAASLVATTVTAHMLAKSACTAPYDPTGAAGAPTGRCSACHMAKTAFTGTYFSGLDADGKTANVMGDVTSHTFAVATPEQSLATVAGASSWDGVMPNACGACHAADRFGL